MTKRTMSIVGLALFIGALAGSGYAQVKIGIVNSQDVLEKSSEGKKIIAG